jgi:hypothetical protein
MNQARLRGILVLLAGWVLGAAAVRADSGAVRWAPGQWAQAVHPAAETNYNLFRDVYERSIMPEIKTKNPLNFGPVGLRYGPQEKDIAFLIFTGKKGNTDLPEEMHLYIPGHKQFNHPKAFRMKPVAGRAVFDKVAFTVESSGFTRNIQGEIRHGPGYPGYIGMDLTVTTTIGKQKASMLVHMKEESEEPGPKDRDKFKSYSLLGVPKLQLRAFADGTQLSATVMIKGGGYTQWFVFPLEGVDKEITVSLVDESGTVVETTKMTTTPKTFTNLESWIGKLKNVKKDQKYTVKAKLNLGPWYGDLTAEVKTFLVPKPL